MNLGPKHFFHKTKSFAQLLKHSPSEAARRLRGYFKDPVFVFQMGKVGSRTHCNTLGTRYRTFHMHTKATFAEKYNEALSFKANLERGPNDIITIMREPIGRKISAFFQNLIGDHYQFSFESEKEVLDAGVSELIQRFHSWEDGVESATEWYDKHFEPATGVNLYDHEFNHSQGWSILHSDRWRILVLRFSDINRNHLFALNHFVVERFGPKAEIDCLRNTNLSGRKYYSNLLSEFREKVVFSTEELDRAYSSTYMRHFHSEGEIEQMKSKWRSH